MRMVKFFTKKGDLEMEVCRVWAEAGRLCGTGNEVWLTDLHEWFERSGEELEKYLEDLHRRFDGDFLYASRYEEPDDPL